MKKFLTAIVFFAGLFIFTACEPSSGVSVPFDKSTVYIYMTLSPVAENASGATVYEAWCQITDSTYTRTFNDAVVRINGNQVDRLAYINSYYKSNNIGSFEAGDSITFTLEDGLLGTISLAETVPASLSDFTASPALPASGTANTETEYDLSWTAVAGVDCYTYYTKSYESSIGTLISGIGDDTVVTNHTMNTQDWDLDTAGYLTSEWISLSVNTRNKTVIPDFRSGSVFRVDGSKRIFKHN